MRIATVQHSPFPSIKSIQTVRLILNNTEWNAVCRARDVLQAAEARVTDYFRAKPWVQEQYGDRASDVGLGDIDFDLRRIFYGAELDEFLEAHGTEGLKIDDA